MAALSLAAAIPLSGAEIPGRPPSALLGALRPSVGQANDHWFGPGLILGKDRLRQIANIIASIVERHAARRKLKDEERAKPAR